MMELFIVTWIVLAAVVIFAIWQMIENGRLREKIDDRAYITDIRSANERNEETRCKLNALAEFQGIKIGYNDRPYHEFIARKLREGEQP